MYDEAQQLLMVSVVWSNFLHTAPIRRWSDIDGVHLVFQSLPFTVRSNIQTPFQLS